MPRKQRESALPSIALVFGYIAVKDLPNAREKIRVLSRLGYGNKEIAQICGTTAGRVAVEKSISRKTLGKRTKKGQ